MDPITERVRAMYERYPYPTKPRGAISDIHPLLLLSYLQGPLPPRALRILDAGCGTGTASLGTAMCNPQAQVTAVDLNRSALAQVRAEQAELGLQNLSIHEANLSTFEGLDPPEGGFDVIFCSGVLHHLSDPAHTLGLLREALAARGVLRLMVYGRHGRHGLYRFVQALDAIHPRRDELESRLALGRRLMRSLVPGGPATQAPWEQADQVDDVEFVDRYLNLHDQSYTIGQLLELVRGAGLKVLRWYEPRHWEASAVCAQPELLADLSQETRWSVVELLSHRPQLDLILCHPQAEARRRAEDLSLAGVALSPQAAIRVSQRVAGGTMMQYQAMVSLREGVERPLGGAEKLVLDQASPGPVRVGELQRLSPAQALVAVKRLLREEILYRPPD